MQISRIAARFTQWTENRASRSTQKSLFSHFEFIQQPSYFLIARIAFAVSGFNVCLPCIA